MNEDVANARNTESRCTVEIDLQYFEMTKTTSHSIICQMKVLLNCFHLNDCTPGFHPEEMVTILKCGWYIVIQCMI